jgi:AcrR family transcriptional regulator
MTYSELIVILQQRRDREKSELRQAILAAARHIAAAEGWGSVSIRRIAERIEYSPPVIYQYFDDKEALQKALVLEGFVELLARIRAARAAAPQPAVALIQAGIAYWQYGHQHPEMYQVMFGLGGVNALTWDEHQKPQEILAVVDEMCSIILAAVGSDRLLYPVEECFQLYWSALHGLVSLSLADRLMSGPEQSITLVNKSVQALSKGLVASK